MLGIARYNPKCIWHHLICPEATSQPITEEWGGGGGKARRGEREGEKACNI